MNAKPHFHLFKIPVRIELSFLFLVFLLGWLMFLGGGGPHAVEMFIVWVPMVTVAILLHELGHALTAKAFGITPHIALHGMGGTTAYPARDHRRLSHGRRFLVTLMGPVAGMVVGLVAAAIAVFAPVEAETLAYQSLWVFVFVTLGWGVLNLLPMMPLDGGHLVSTILEKFFGVQGRLFARLVSLGAAVALAGLLLYFELHPFNLLIIAFLAFQNWRAYQAERHLQKEEPFGEVVKAGYAALAAGELDKAQDIAAHLEMHASTPGMKRHVAHLAGWSHLLSGRVDEARDAVATLPKGELPDAYLEGRIWLESGEPERAVQPLVEGLVQRGEDEVAERLAAAAIGANRFDELIGLFESRDRASAAGQRALQVVVARVFEAGRYEEAASLAERLFARFDDGLDAFNAACAHSRAGRLSRALEWLSRALDAGLDDPSVLETDPDLEALRGDPAFGDLLARAEAGAPTRM